MMQRKENKAKNLLYSIDLPEMIYLTLKLRSCTLLLYTTICNFIAAMEVKLVSNAKA